MLTRYNALKLFGFGAAALTSGATTACTQKKAEQKPMNIVYIMYEESFRTPLIISYPGCKGGSTSGTLVQNLDFGPTFLDIAGAAQPDNMYGLSMVPVLEGSGVEPKEWRKTLYYHFYDHTPEHNVMRHDGLFDKRYKLIHFYDETGKIPSYEEFFDLQEDPNELRNVIDEPKYKSLVEKFKKELTETRSQVGVTEF